MRRRLIAAVSAAVGAICIIYYILCGVLGGFAMSGLWIWLCFGLIMLFVCVWTLCAEPRVLAGRCALLYKRLRIVLVSAFALFFAAFAVFEGLLIARWSDGTDVHSEKPDVLIVLGAAVEYDSPSAALSARISTAWEYLSEMPDIPVIACGGIGEGDIISEAAVIKRELVALGASPELIFTEEDSATTAENFLYAAALLPENTRTVAVVTSGFHLLRAAVTGYTSLERAGIDNVTLIPVSAPYLSPLLPYSMVREFAAFVKDISLGNIRIHRVCLSL